METGAPGEISSIVLASHWKGFGKNFIVRKGSENIDFSLQISDDEILIKNLI